VAAGLNRHSSISDTTTPFRNETGELLTKQYYQHRQAVLHPRWFFMSAIFVSL
jgi:hypothetical protein